MSSVIVFPRSAGAGSLAVKSVKRYWIATEQKNREAAFKLVYDAYLKAGIGRANPFRMRVLPFHLLETTEVFCAELDGEVALTMTLVRDGALGLPMESVYGKEVETLRHKGFGLAEVSCLADQCAMLGKSFLPVFVDLSRILAQYARKKGVDALLAAMHPHHAPFYQRVLGFEQFGGERAYPNAADRPAVGMILNFEVARSCCQKQYKRLFDNPIPDKRLQAIPISEKQKKYFAPMV